MIFEIEARVWITVAAEDADHADAIVREELADKNFDDFEIEEVTNSGEEADGEV